MEIAAVIQENRRKKGYTQERLAELVGVSTPAVSKWESGASCPDIMLLAPIARALGITVDMLLGFSADLSDEEVNALTQECGEVFHREGADAGCARCEALLHEYPNCTYLKLCVAGVYQRALFASQAAPEMVLERIYELYQQVYDSGDARLHEAVTVILAGKALADEEISRAETLLGELPKVEYSAESLYPLLHLKKGEPEKAMELLAKQVVKLGNELGTALNSLTSICAQQGDVAQALACCQAGAGVAEALGLHGVNAFLQSASLLAKHGTHEEAVQALVRYLDGIRALGTGYSGHPFLSRVEMSPQPEQVAGIQRTLLEGAEQEEQFAPLFEDVRVQAALERLRESMQTEK